MRLKLLQAGTWQILAPIDDDDCCEVLEALIALAAHPKTLGTAAGFRAQWRSIPVEGPRALGVNYHRVDDDNEINEFRKCNHRLLCFEAGGRLIVCSHVMRKKGQKTPKADRKRAARLRNAYLAAEKAKDITVVSD